jgi:uncharacterized membrane protein required for colicin V production
MHRNIAGGYWNRIMWVDLIVIAILFFSLIGGLLGGAVRSFFALLALFIAIPITGFLYRLVANLLSSLPGQNWENFLGFFITFALISLILNLIFIIPARLIEKAWLIKGILFRLIGGILNVFDAAIGMVLFVLVLRAYPVMGWLEHVVAESTLLTWLTFHCSFVRWLLPQLPQHAITSLIAVVTG